MNILLNLEEQSTLVMLVEKELEQARKDLAYCIQCVEEKNSAQDGWKMKVEKYQQKVIHLVSITNKL